MGPLIFLLIVGIIVAAVYYQRRNVAVATRLKVIDTAVEAKLQAAGVDLADVAVGAFARLRNEESRGKIAAGTTERFVALKMEMLKEKASGLVAKL